MKIKVVPVQKSHLETIPEAELAFYTHFGHVRNELLVIEKFLYWTIKNPTDRDVLSDVNVFQELTYHKASCRQTLGRLAAFE